jgi:phage shock protein A
MEEMERKIAEMHVAGNYEAQHEEEGPEDIDAKKKNGGAVEDLQSPAKVGPNSIDSKIWEL